MHACLSKDPCLTSCAGAAMGCSLTAAFLRAIGVSMKSETCEAVHQLPSACMCLQPYLPLLPDSLPAAHFLMLHSPFAAQGSRVVFWRYRAAAPATKGTAWEVPERSLVAVSLSLLALRMLVPGPQMSTQLP